MGDRLQPRWDEGGGRCGSTVPGSLGLLQFLGFGFPWAVGQTSGEAEPCVPLPARVADRCDQRSARQRDYPTHREVPGGHVAQGLTGKLLDFDLCIVPIHGSRSRAEGYCRYSIPSRVSELFAAGVPIFSIGDSGSAFAEYLEQTGAGVHASAEPLDVAASKLVELIESPELRRAMGLAGRGYAESHFEADHFRAKLKVRLERLR